MTALAWIFVVFMMLFGILCIIYSCFTARRKESIFTNAYLSRSDKEHEKNSQTPGYRTITVLSACIGIIFCLLSVKTITGWNWMFIPTSILVIGTTGYAVYDARALRKRR